MPADPHPDKVLLTPRQVWLMLGLTKATFYRRLRHDPAFPRPVSVAGRPRYRKEDLERWLHRLPEVADEPAAGGASRHHGGQAAGPDHRPGRRRRQTPPGPA